MWRTANEPIPSTALAPVFITDDLEVAQAPRSLAPAL